MRRPVLVQAMPVQTRRFIAQMIPHRNNKSFPYRDMESRYRPLTVYAHNRPVVSTIRVAVDPRDIEFEVRDFRACCATDEQQQRPQHTDHRARWCRGVIERNGREKRDQTRHA